MNSALVTGASSGIGLEIANMLVRNQFIVHGISRRKPGSDSILHIPIDLSNLSLYENELKAWQKKLKDLRVLVHSAGVGLFGLHEELNLAKLKNMMDVNLNAPILLTRLFLRTLKENKGWVVFISSITAHKSSPLASAYSASKAGLSQFAASLWEEARKSGLRVICIEPDMTHSEFYAENWFDVDSDPESFLEPVEIADVLEYALKQRDSVNIHNIKIQPRLHKIKKSRKENENN